uniref:Beta-2-microglobulin n=1 Tax=Rostroraja eglanteria TaxID=3360502 RepID=B2MG_ROSEG|nr:RecName: Full=Beta-2-microglobulin; Flags: Precursor [Raja eglanteria]AAN62852.1 beta-2 microglobulin [Raja eglanteria]
MRALILLSLGLLRVAVPSPPQVVVYTYKPVVHGEKNTLLCHAKEFNPPNVELQLFEDGNVFSQANQTDLSFESNWKFKLTKFIELIPREDVEYSCHVMYMGKTSIYKLESF